MSSASTESHQPGPQEYADGRGPRILERLGLILQDLDNKVILDLGAGSERPLERYLATANPTAEAHSLDIGKTILDEKDIEPDTGSAKAVVADASDALPFADEQFDMILIPSVPVNEVHILPEILRVLRRGGEIRIASAFKLGAGEASVQKALFDEYRERLKEGGLTVTELFPADIEEALGESLEDFIKRYLDQVDVDGLPLPYSKDEDEYPFWPHIYQLLPLDEQRRIWRECLERFETRLFRRPHSDSLDLEADEGDLENADEYSPVLVIRKAEE